MSPNVITTHKEITLR